MRRPYFRLTCVAQKRLCLSSLIPIIHIFQPKFVKYYWLPHFVFLSSINQGKLLGKFCHPKFSGLVKLDLWFCLCCCLFVSFIKTFHFNSARYGHWHKEKVGISFSFLKFFSTRLMFLIATVAVLKTAFTKFCCICPGEVYRCLVCGEHDDQTFHFPDILRIEACTYKSIPNLFYSTYSKLNKHA